MRSILLIIHWLCPVSQGMLTGLLAMAIHECGHLLVASVLGIRIKRVTLHWKGLCTVREAGSPMKNLLISVAGPFVNLVLVSSWQLSPIFGIANLCFAFFNMLPIEGSDGERALKCWEQIKGAHDLA